MSETEPIQFPIFKISQKSKISSYSSSESQSLVAFNRLELNLIMNMYGRKVAAGEWRDYALDMTRDKAIFSIFRHSSECPLYKIEKNPRLARKQGVYSVQNAAGFILKRGKELQLVLAVLNNPLRLINVRG